jgi:CubicO group peptidase (beta-lactamase class C family)
MNPKIKYLLLGLVFWFLMFLGWEWWNSHPRVRIIPSSFPQSREEKIDSLLIQSLNHFLIPGLAVGIIEEEKVTYLKAFGFENLESKDSLTLQSQLPIASVSKIFTALTFANYALEKGISIDTSVNSILTDEKKLSPEYFNISIQELLNHKSGLAQNRSLKRLLPGGRNKPLAELPESLNDPILDQKDFNYADDNHDLIGFLLQTTTGVPFEEASQARILNQGGMEASNFVTHWPSATSSATGYQRTFLWKRLEPSKLVFEILPSPSSGLLATPEDLSKALLHLCRGEMGTFSDELDWLKNGTDIPAGFQQITLNNSEFIGHYGGQAGFSALLIYSPNLDLGIFLMANSRDQADYRDQIMTELLQILNP